MKEIKTTEQVNNLLDLLSIDSSDKVSTGSFFTRDVFVKYHLGSVNVPIFVVFANASSLTKAKNLSDPDYSPWGYDFIRKQGYNVISFSCCNSPNWYRAPLTINIIKKISNIILPYKEKLGYGSSMGAYAVGAYCDLLQLNRCFLFCPISTLNPDTVPSEKKHPASITQNWATEYNDGGFTICPKYVIFDPFLKRDKMHAHRYKNAQLIHFRGVGRSIPKHALAVNVLKDCFNVLVTDSLPSSDFYRKIRNGKRKYNRYFEFISSKYNSHLTEKRINVIKSHRNKYLETLTPEEKIRGTKTGLEKKTIISNQDVDIIRDLSLFLEGVDLRKAHQLMEVASRARPKGMFIQRKLIEYKKKLNIK